MTSVIGIVADKGIVLLSDSQGTYRKDMTRPGRRPSKVQVVRKLYETSNTSDLRAVVGYSGFPPIGESVVTQLKELYTQQLDLLHLMEKTGETVRKTNFEFAAENGVTYDKQVETLFLVGLYIKKPILYLALPMGKMFAQPAAVIGSGRDLISRDLESKFSSLNPPTLTDAISDGYELLYRSMTDLGVSGPVQASVITETMIHDFSTKLRENEERMHRESKEFLRDEVSKL